MRLLSFLGLSYAAVATALTNVGFGGKRESYKHLQELRRSRCRAPTARRSTSSRARSPSRARSAPTWVSASRFRIYL